MVDYPCKHSNMSHCYSCERIAKFRGHQRKDQELYEELVDATGKLYDHKFFIWLESDQPYHQSHHNKVPYRYSV